MDARTKKRLRITREIMALLRTRDDFRDYLSSGEEPVMVALDDDKVGEVFEHAKTRAIESEVDRVRIIMRLPRRPGDGTRFYCVNMDDFDRELDSEDAMLIAPESEWGMLVDLMMADPGPRRLTIQSSPLSFQLVGAAS